MPLEQAILDIAKGFARHGKMSFYGYELKHHLAGHITGGLYGEYRGAATGTTYRALARLVKMGHLECQWEELAPGANRPSRRYYSLVDETK